MSLLLDMQYFIARVSAAERLASSETQNDGAATEGFLAVTRQNVEDSVVETGGELREGWADSDEHTGRTFDYTLVAIDCWAQTEFIGQSGSEVMEIGRWAEQDVQEMAQKALDFFKHTPNAVAMMIGSSLFILPCGPSAPVLRLAEMSHASPYVRGIMRNVPTGNVYLILKSAAAGGPGATVINAIVAALALIVNTFRLVEHYTARCVLNKAVDMIRAERVLSLQDAVDGLQALVKQAWDERVRYIQEVD